MAFARYPRQPLRSLHSLKAELKTGDILLFSGRSLISKVIQLFTFSRWSHIGLVIRDPATGRLLLWEATTENTVDDIELGRRTRSVQLVNLEEKVRSYRGVVAVRHLKGVELDPDMVDELEELVRRLRTAPYQNYVLEWFRYYMGYRCKNLDRVFCSQLIAEVYQRLKLIPAEKPSIFYTPKDFSPERRVRLVRGRLSRPYIISTC